MKPSNLIIVTTIAAFGLSACGATTGGMRSALAQSAASNAVMAAQAPTETATPVVALSPITVGADMSPECVALAEEIGIVDARILTAQNVVNGEAGATIAGQAAAAAATQGALHNGAAGMLGRVPFGGMFAKAAVDSVANSGKRKADEARQVISSSTVERATLVGRYQGMECGAS